MEDQAIVVNKPEEELIDLPPGFRFHPTDEEIISYYLTEKVLNCNFSASAIGEADLNKSEPWDLPTKMGEKEWYFFCQRDRKYPTGMRTNRATESGYWKATGKDKEIYKGKGGGGGSGSCLVGMKKTLVFYKGRAPKGEKTNWVMHEYRLEGKFSYYNLPKSAKDEWVVCRVFHKNMGIKKSIPNMNPIQGGLLMRMSSVDNDSDHLLIDSCSLPPLMDINPYDGRHDHHHQQQQELIKGTTTVPSPTTRTSQSQGAYFNYLSNIGSNNDNHQQQQTKQHNQSPNPNQMMMLKSLQQLPTSTSTSYQAPSLLMTNHHPILYSQLLPNIPPSPPPPHYSNLIHPNLSSTLINNLGGYFEPPAGGNNTSDYGHHHHHPHQQASGGNYNNNNNDGLILEMRQCKVEQLSSNNQSMVSLSQDTGLSTDVNTTAEISSSVHVSKPDDGQAAAPSIPPISDIEAFNWDDF
ncbi:hypothetical protein FEM48_Zijuj07G0174600 [Ziziphus jujuba var. spinosa]|uniref:NAC domain-containing protein n=1 Tax=Ziziphus jujuba var. spinosa TaxID=714518 RepID=A0A978V5Z6_ZIZJJ|nr:hypothetical protein FEM48_Zijuj07G0174600 [Ziziphus jujuba var. spinosa]